MTGNMYGTQMPCVITIKNSKRATHFISGSHPENAHVLWFGWAMPCHKNRNPRIDVSFHLDLSRRYRLSSSVVCVCHFTNEMKVCLVSWLGCSRSRMTLVRCLFHDSLIVFYVIYPLLWLDKVNNFGDGTNALQREMLLGVLIRVVGWCWYNLEKGKN